MIEEDIWHHYYQQTRTRAHTPRTEFALHLNNTSCKIAIDIGCGTGSDIAYLANKNYQVYGLDINPEAISICNKRFAQNDFVTLATTPFEDYNYPNCALIIAESSLFFADPARFPATWQRIINSLKEGGVFAGDFMGVNDSWANGYHSTTTVFTRVEVEALFSDFEIIRFQERDELGTTRIGKTKHWHTYSIVAVKQIS